MHSLEYVAMTSTTCIRIKNGGRRKCKMATKGSILLGSMEEKLSTFREAISLCQVQHPEKDFGAEYVIHWQAYLVFFLILDPPLCRSLHGS